MDPPNDGSRFVVMVPDRIGRPAAPRMTGANPRRSCAVTGPSGINAANSSTRVRDPAHLPSGHPPEQRRKFGVAVVSPPEQNTRRCHLLRDAASAAEPVRSEPWRACGHREARRRRHSRWSARPPRPGADVPLPVAVRNPSRHLGPQRSRSRRGSPGRSRADHRDGLAPPGWAGGHCGEEVQRPAANHREAHEQETAPPRLDTPGLRRSMRTPQRLRHPRRCHRLSTVAPARAVGAEPQLIAAWDTWQG